MNKLPAKEYHCPKCNRIIYDRSHPLCGYCGEALPKEFMLSAEEIAAMKKEKEELEAESRRMQAEQQHKGRKPKKSFSEDSQLMDETP